VDGLVKLDGRWTVVMEYIDGVDLSRVVDAGRPVPARAAVEIVGEVAAALHVAFHAPGDDGRPLALLHRDIKPANVVLTAAGEVKVLDFGVARTDLASREARTRGMRFGSPGYVAPERLEGEELPAGDVYSLGVVFWELLAGGRLARPSVRRDRSEQHMNEALAQLGVQDPEVEGLIREMLAWDPKDRPSTRDVERRCRSLAARLSGPFLRDWAEEAVPPLLAARSLDQSAEDFSAEVVEEGRPTNPPVPEKLVGSALRTFDGDLEPEPRPERPPAPPPPPPPALAPRAPTVPAGSFGADLALSGGVVGISLLVTGVVLFGGCTLALCAGASL
jgi:serine/threonine-protein kinase